jgi:hypothetical protein
MLAAVVAQDANKLLAQVHGLPQRSLYQSPEIRRRSHRIHLPAVASAAYSIGYPLVTLVVTTSGTNTVTIPVRGLVSLVVASDSQSC